MDRPRGYVRWIGVIAAALAVGGMAASALAADAGQACRQGIQALQQRDLNRALAGFDQAVRLDPSQPRFRGLRGTAWICKGEIAKGIADLSAAIRMNPDDAGIGYQPWLSVRLSDQAQQHGRQQVARMLHDRPAMNRYGADADFLRRWAARRFAGEGIGPPIIWDPTPPLHSDAEHLAPTNDEPGAILVERFYTDGPKRGAERSFEELWAGAIYELHNIGYAKHYVWLNDQAARGRVSKAAFVAGILRYELQAAQQTRAFYVNLYLPWVEKKKLGSDPSLWFADWWPDPNRVLQQFTDRSAYPWRPYARQHDWATVRYRWGQGRLAKALSLLRQMRGERGYEAETADVQLWIGRCLLRLGKPDQAVAALSESIRLDPSQSEAYQLRAQAYQRLGAKQKAAADFAKAKQTPD